MRLGLFLISLACVGFPSLTRADAPPPAPVDDRPFRYEPPSAERVYPPVDGEPDDGPTPEGEAEGPPPAEAPAADAREPAPGPAAQAAPTEPAPAAQAEQPAGAGATDAAGESTASAGPIEPLYGASGRAQVREAGRKELTLEDARDLPGGFGDPLRVIELLPGIIPVSSGLPYFYSRGSPPANQGYRFDGLLLPQLFHVAIGPQVLHPRMFGGIDYYGAVAPTNFGRRSGALVDVQPAPHGYSLLGEVDLRALDVNGFVEAPVLGGNLQAAARYGGPLLGAFVKDLSLHYWDGQVRYEVPLDNRTRIQLVWVGSYDNADGLPVGSGPAETNSVYLQFHRVALRAIRDTPRGGELGVSLRFGYDDSALGTALSSTAFTVGPRLWYEQPFGAGHRLEVGADMLGSTGSVTDEGGTLGGLDGQLQVDLPTIGEAAARNQGGVYGEVRLRTSATTRLHAGARVDMWHVQDVVNVGVDPRLRFTWQATDTTEVHAAAGIAHQPSVFLLPLAGLSEVALSDTLTRNYQAEVGIRQGLPWNIEVEVTPFLSYQQNLLLPELVVDGQIGEDPPLVDARATGLELFAQGDIQDRLRFMASYTLGYARALSAADVLGEFSPDFDVRHVLNLSARYDWVSGFNLGVRFGARSGRVIEQQNPRYTQRLPWFSRLDLRFGYSWQGRFAKMDAYIEWLNATLQAEYLDADCFFGQCVADRAPILSVPNLGVRATFDGSRRRRSHAE